MKRHTEEIRALENRLKSGLPVEDTPVVDGDDKDSEDKIEAVIVNEKRVEGSENVHQIDSIELGLNEPPLDIRGSLQTENDRDNTETKDLRTSLFEWAVKHQITHSAIYDLLHILREEHPDLPKDPRTLLSSFKVSNIKSLSGGEYYYFGVEVQLVSLLETYEQLRQFQHFSLQINVDGLPLYKSSGTQLWPILCRLEDAPTLDPVVIGLYSGESKPKDPIEYLSDFVNEMQNLYEHGFLYMEKVYSVSISNVVCDVPARAFIKNTKHHNGYSACDKCTQEGEHYDRRMCFPETDSPLRTNVSFEERIDDEHHKGPNPFQGINIGMVTQFPIDYMHLVCLGVMKKLLSFWLGKGPVSVRIPYRIQTKISECLVSLSPYISCDFARKTRSLMEVGRWKATEFRLFLLYTGPVALLDNVDKEIYDNFMLLSVGIHILCHPLFFDRSSNFAKSSCEFCETFCQTIWYCTDFLQCPCSHTPT